MLAQIEGEIMTYTNRKLETQTVAKREHNGDWYAITGSGGWTAGCSKEVYDLLPKGKEYTLETRNFSEIAGWSIDGVWYSRKTDEDFERERIEWLANYEREKRERLEVNRAKWQEQEDALPEWMRDRVRVFHENGGHEFELSGWGYELCVADLAVLYVASNLVDDEAVNAYAEAHGTSGNQHDMAKALAKARINEPDFEFAGTVSALSPITGDPLY